MRKEVQLSVEREIIERYHAELHQCEVIDRQEEHVLAQRAKLGDEEARAKLVVLENNNEHLTQRSAAGLPLVRQEVALGFYRWVAPDTHSGQLCINLFHRPCEGL
jgi:hypothetical protein